MRRVFRNLIPFVLVAAFVACSAREDGPEVGGTATTSVRVENQAFSDMAVYVLNGTQRVRLGTVPGVSDRTFPIPDRLVFGITSLRFQVDPVGSSRAPISQEIAVSEGQTVRLIIPPSVR